MNQPDYTNKGSLWADENGRGYSGSLNIEGKTYDIVLKELKNYPAAAELLLKQPKSHYSHVQRVFDLYEPDKSNTNLPEGLVYSTSIKKPKEKQVYAYLSIYLNSNKHSDRSPDLNVRYKINPKYGERDLFQEIQDDTPF